MHIRSAVCRRNPRPGLLHEYADRLVAFEYCATCHAKPHTLLFVGGLGDGMGTVEYLTDIVAALEDTDWSVFAPVLSSSYGGWGTSELGRDIDEIALCVEYILDHKRSLSTDPDAVGSAPKIVIMGHSTGSQDVMQYISTANPRAPSAQEPSRPPIVRPQVDGAILRAPVSDREAIQWVLREGNERHSAEEIRRIYNAAVAHAQQHPFEEYDSLDTIVPLPVTAALGFPAATAVSSRRFLSLASPRSPGCPAEDDLFSSDLAEERLRKTFGMIHVRGVLRGGLLVLYSGQDLSVPPWVDKGVLLRRWQEATDAERVYWHEQSGIVPGASHTLAGPQQVEPRRILVSKVLRFLSDVEGGHR